MTEVESKQFPKVAKCLGSSRGPLRADFTTPICHHNPVRCSVTVVDLWVQVITHLGLPPVHRPLKVNRRPLPVRRKVHRYRLDHPTGIPSCLPTVIAFFQLQGTAEVLGENLLAT